MLGKIICTKAEDGKGFLILRRSVVELYWTEMLGVVGRVNMTPEKVLGEVMVSENPVQFCETIPWLTSW